MVMLTSDNTMTSDPHSHLGQGHPVANMAALAAENRQLRDELRESCALMHTYSAEMRRVKTVNDTAGVLMKERHAQMKRIVSHFVNQMAAPVDLSEDVGSLKAQVLSLCHELEQLHQVHAADVAYGKENEERSQALELRCGQFEERLSKQRLDDDEVINALHAKITELESELSAVRRRTEVAILEKNEVHAEFKSLFNDHHDLLRQMDTSTQQTQHGELTSMRSGHQVVLQSLASKESEVRELEEKVVLLTEQANIYSADFDAERRAREEMHSEKDNVMGQLEIIKDENAQLRAMLASQQETFRCPKCQRTYAIMDKLQDHMLACIG